MCHESPREGTVTFNATNDDNSSNGAHHIFVELVKCLSGLDADDMIITEINATIKFIEDKDVTKVDVEYLGENDGCEICIDRTALNRLQGFKNITNLHMRSLLQFIEEYAGGNKHGWMEKAVYKDFVDKLMPKMSLVWNARILHALLDLADHMLLNGDTVDWRDVNELFRIFDLPYHIRCVNEKYIVDQKD